MCSTGQGKERKSWALGVAQLVERSLPTTDDFGSNPANFYFEHLFTVNCKEKTENKEKETENGTFH